MDASHLVIRDLQQVQHDLVGIHILQQPLLLLPHLLPDPAHLVQPLQDLRGRQGDGSLLPPPQGASSTWSAAGTGEGKASGLLLLNQVIQAKSHPAPKVQSNTAVKWNLIKFLRL